MSYPPPSPYDPNRQPGYGQPTPQQPQHFTTDSDPYSRPDPYAQNPYSGPPMSVQPGSIPPGPPPVQGFGQTQGFQTAPPFQPSPLPPSGGSSRTPLMVTILVIVVALAIGGVFTATLIGGDDEGGIADDATTGEATTAAEETTEPSPEPTEEAAEQAVEGDCVPENYGSGVGEEIVVDCSDESAFWTITKVDNDAAVSITNGDVTDFQDAVDICGDSVYARIPGEAWVDYNFVYDEDTGVTSQFFCLEGIQEPNADGQIPRTPGAGDCFDEDLSWPTVDCSSASAIGEVVDAIPVDPPEQDMSQSDAEALAGQCSGGEYYWQVEDELGRTGGVVCGYEL